MKSSKGFAFVSLITITLSFCSAVQTASAVGRDGEEPIHINARSIETNDRSGVAIYSGNVKARQGRLTILADRIEVRVRRNKTKIIRASGKPVKLHQRADVENEEIRAEARRMNYLVPEKKIEMTGTATLRRGKDVFSGGKLSYDLDARSLSAQGDEKTGGHVHAVIHPENPDTRSASGS